MENFLHFFKKYILWELSILVHRVACVCFNSHPPITILALDSCYDQIMASNYILLYYLLRNWFLNAQWNILHFFMSNLTAVKIIFIHYIISKKVFIESFHWFCVFLIEKDVFSNLSSIFQIISKYMISFLIKKCKIYRCEVII